LVVIGETGVGTLARFCGCGVRLRVALYCLLVRYLLRARCLSRLVGHRSGTTFGNAMGSPPAKGARDDACE
jgi:hypothetical protein